MTTLAELRAAGYLSPLDFHFAQTLARLASEKLGEKPRPEVLLAAALASRQMTEGHVCVDLAAPRIPVDDAGEPLAELSWPASQAWIDALKASALVTVAGTNDEPPPTPLVVDPAGRLYLQRLWCHQEELARSLLDRARLSFEPRDAERLRRDLVRLFPESDASFPWQRVAGITAARRGLTVVTGGPGTGKTATVVRMLALLISEAQGAGDRSPRILLLAPTGKAAARLTESVEAAIPRLTCEEKIVTELPRAASTIHRVLGPIGSTASRFRHDADHPLLADIVVVDEASMVDLALMNRLMAAIPRVARLILLGDRDQLASVEAGAVLGDLCDPRALESGYSRPHLEDLSRLGSIDFAPEPTSAAETGLRDSIVRLVHSYRYGGRSGIGCLAAAIRDRNAEEALRILESDEFPDVVRLDPPPLGSLHEVSERKIVEGFRASLEAPDPRAALEAMNGFRVLCAHRRGPFGVEALNARIVAILRETGLLGDGDSHYPGRAVLITRNDYALSLFNGDVGLVVRNSRDSEDRDRLEAVFAAAGGALRRFSPARLPTHETAFAMTVHKSQGSEVDELVLVLPEKSPVVTRELLYTAVTRARSGVVVQASRHSIAAGIMTETERASGLRDLLWADSVSPWQLAFRRSMATLRRST